MLLLAGFLASAPARNSDLWMHLATGRALFDGSYRFGSDPFAHTTAASYWVNHAWLWDAASYVLYAGLGGAALMAFKTLIVVALAAVLLLLTWRPSPRASLEALGVNPRGSRTRLGAWRWAALLGVSFALVAMGPYLALRPTCISYLFLGLTLWWLERRAEPASGDHATRPAQILPLLILFVLWVNLDEWFLLGPLLVALYALGIFLDARRRPIDSAERKIASAKARTLGWTLLAGLAACLVNPHHVRAFTLPALLGPAASWLGEEPWEPLGSVSALGYFGQPGMLFSPAGIAYLGLVFGGLVSFAINSARWRWPWGLAWVMFFVLSVYRSGTIPFFAVVGGFILIRNVQEALADSPARTATRRGLRAGRAWTVVGAGLLGALPLAAWPGWLQTLPPEPRQWTLHADPSLEYAAAQLRRWRGDGALGPEARGFALTPSVAHYLAWFCPEERGFIDGRRHLFPAAVGADYLTIKQGLLDGLSDAGGDWRQTDWETSWREVLARRGITHVIIHDSSGRRLTTALGKLLKLPAEWHMIHAEGRTTIFRWNAGQAAQIVAVPPVNLERRAFQPTEAETAPAGGPERDPQPRAWWHAFWKPRLSVDRNRDEAFIFLTHFDAQAAAFRRTHRAVWENGLAASLTAVAAPGAGPSVLPSAYVAASLLKTSLNPPTEPARTSAMDRLAGHAITHHLAHSDDGPVGSLLLAIRAARRAIHANPDDPISHLLLGRAYLRLLHHTQERTYAQHFAMLRHLRYGQAVTALKNAVRLKPDFTDAHAHLADVFAEMRHFDLAAEHLTEALKHTRAAGRPAGESADQFAQRLQRLEQESKAVKDKVRDAVTLYEVQASNRDVLTRAILAEQAGLAGRSLEILLASEPRFFGKQGAALELQLLVATGGAVYVRDWRTPEQEDFLGAFDYHWLQAQAAAALGNYRAADGELAALATPVKAKQESPRVTLAIAVGKCVLDHASPTFLVLPDDAVLLERTGLLATALIQEAEFRVLRGLLALEAGEMAHARRLFRDSLDFWNTDAAAPALARRFLSLLP